MALWDRRRRFGLGLAGVALGVIARSFYDLRAADHLLPLTWVALFGVASVLTVALAVAPTARQLFRVAGPLTIASLVARPVAVWGNYAAGYTSSGWAVVLAVVLYGAGSMLYSLWWFDRVGPWQVRHLTGATVGGD